MKHSLKIILQAFEEERLVYERSSSKIIFLNLAVHALRRLRDETVASAATSPSKNPNLVSHEAVLGGSKACHTSFTVNRCGKQSAGPSSFSGNFCLCCCEYVSNFIKTHTCSTK